MIYDPVALAPAVSFHRLRDDALWLEQLLAERQIALLPGSELVKALDLAKALPDLSASDPDDFDPRSLAAPLGLIFLSRALQDAKANPTFDKIARLLPELAGDAGVPVAQDSNRTDERDLVFELEMAAILGSMGASVESAEEPDVVFKYDGATWDVACKLIYSKNPVTLNNRLEEGIRQVLSFDSQYGLVCVGVTNRVDHKKFMPLIGDIGHEVWGVFRNGDDAEDAIRTTLEETHAAIMSEKNVRFLRGRETYKFRGVVTVLHAVVALGTVATILTAIGFLSRNDLFGELVIGPEEALTKRLHDRVQNIFTG
jgi:hypothetical protein